MNMETSKLYVSVNVGESDDTVLDVTTYVFEVGSTCYVDNYNVTKVSYNFAGFVVESADYQDVVKACEIMPRETLEARILEAVSTYLQNANDPHLVSWVPES
jgi:hypothetical protein